MKSFASYFLFLFLYLISRALALTTCRSPESMTTSPRCCCCCWWRICTSAWMYALSVLSLLSPSLCPAWVVSFIKSFPGKQKQVKVPRGVTRRQRKARSEYARQYKSIQRTGHGQPSVCCCDTTGKMSLEASAHGERRRKTNAEWFFFLLLYHLAKRNVPIINSLSTLKIYILLVDMLHNPTLQPVYIVTPFVPQEEESCSFVDQRKYFPLWRHWWWGMVVSVRIGYRFSHKINQAVSQPVNTEKESRE